MNGRRLVAGGVIIVAAVILAACDASGIVKGTKEGLCCVAGLAVPAMALIVRLWRLI